MGELLASIELELRLSLAQQKEWQIRTDFTTPLFYNYSLKSDYEDYKRERRGSYLSSLVVVLRGLGLAERRYPGISGSTLKA